MSHADFLTELESIVMSGTKLDITYHLNDMLEADTQQEIMDYFRKVNDDVVIGLGDIKGKPLDFFFHLTRV